jgi:hypothetical protein
MTCIVPAAPHSQTTDRTLVFALQTAEINLNTSKNTTQDI